MVYISNKCLVNFWLKTQKSIQSEIKENIYIYKMYRRDQEITKTAHCREREKLCIQFKPWLLFYTWLYLNLCDVKQGL